MRQGRPFRIGLHAPRNAGKTCLFACLYGLRQGQTDEVTFDNDETLAYLKSIWKYLKDGTVPPATAMAKPMQLAWRLRSGGDAWDLLTCDYPGALVEPATAAGAARELKDDARAWFRSCDALLILVDCSAPDVEQVDVVDVLLSELRKESRDGKTIARPLALVLTKWDTRGPVAASRDDERDRLQKYLVDNPVFERIRRTLRESGGRFEVFAVSAFGKPCPAPGVAPAIDEMQPYQILVPWKWAATQCDMVARAQRKKRRAGRLRGIAVVVTLVTALAAGGYVYGSRQADRRFADLSAFRTANPAETAAADRLAHDDSFLAAWYSWTAPAYRTRVRGWRDADFTVAEAVRLEVARADRARRHAAAHQRVVAEVDRLSKRQGEEPAIYETYKRFLDEFPESEYSSEFRREQSEVREKWDDRIWMELQEFLPKSTDPIKKAQRVQEYVAIPGATRRVDALTYLGKAEGELDQADYDLLRERARTAQDGTALEAVDPLARQYLESPRSVKRMAGAVKAWRDWFDRLHQDNDYTIRVKSVSIPPKGELESIWGIEPRVVVTLGKTSHKTEVHHGYSPSIQEDLGPFKFRWGEPNRLVVRVENDYWFRSNPGIQDPVIDDKFVLGKAHGKVAIKDAKGKVTVVELECPAAVPPALPEYGK